MINIRRWGAAALLVAGIAVWFGLAPDDPDNGSARSGIERVDDANNDLAEGAPQQAVVNGWTGNDYLALISEQLDEAAKHEVRDERPALLLWLCLAGICLIAATPAAPSRPAGSAALTPPITP